MHNLRVPLLNANEDEVVVVDVLVREGDEVRAGQPVCVVESTKMTMDLEAPASGYVRLLSVHKGERVRVGALICILTATKDELLPTSGEATAENQQEQHATRKARELAQRHQIELASMGHAGIIKEQDVMEYLARQGKLQPLVRSQSLKSTVAANSIVLYGARGHAKVLIDIIREARPDLEIIAAVDDGDDAPAEIMGVPVIGTFAELTKLREQNLQWAALGIGSVAQHTLRARLYQKLKATGLKVPNLAHPGACVEPSVTLGEGNQIFAGAVVGSAVRLGENTIVNSGAVVSHDCIIGSHTHLSPGCILAGGVSVGENTLIGMGVTVYLGVRIGSNVVIANGVHVLKDVADGCVLRATGSHLHDG